MKRKAGDTLKKRVTRARTSKTQCKEGCKIFQISKGRNICAGKDVIYKVKCLECEKANKTSTYVGETSQTVKKRISQHIRNFEKGEHDSGIAKHFITEHPNVPEVKIEVEIAAKGNGFVQRKIKEAILVQVEENDMNRKAEGNACVALFW